VLPKVRELCPAGFPAYLIPTYAALADYANNATGLCWPEMETLAWLLGCNEKTVRRHMLKLEELGLVEKLERLRRPDGTFCGYKYRLPHIARAAERIREHRKANQERYEKKKREQEETRERRRKRRLSHRRERGACRSLTASSHPISGEEGARRTREGYEHLFEGAPSAEQLLEARPSRPEPAEAYFAASTGHSRLLAPIYATSRSNHFPPNPPEGYSTERREEAMHRPPEPTPQHQHPTLPAESAWLRVRGALLEAHPDLDPRQLSVLSVGLDGATLSVVLRETPIMSYADPLNSKRIGSTAEQVRSRYGGELSRLWRELSGDSHALIDLSPAS